jgi:hypothetical protein
VVGLQVVCGVDRSSGKLASDDSMESCDIFLIDSAIEEEYQKIMGENAGAGATNTEEAPSQVRQSPLLLRRRSSQSRLLLMKRRRSRMLMRRRIMLRSRRLQRSRRRGSYRAHACHL